MESSFLRVHDTLITFVLAIEVESASFSLVDELRGDARRFLPHISILPRFSLNSEGVSALARKATFGSLPGVIKLRGPREMSDQLAWYECHPQDIGFKELVCLHDKWTLDLSLCARPADVRHWGQAYRPHMTIRSNELASEDPKLPDVLEVRPLRTVLYEFLVGATEPAKRYLLQGACA